MNPLLFGHLETDFVRPGSTISDCDVGNLAFDHGGDEFGEGGGGDLLDCCEVGVERRLGAGGEQLVRSGGDETFTCIQGAGEAVFGFSDGFGEIFFLDSRGSGESFQACYCVSSGLFEGFAGAGEEEAKEGSVGVGEEDSLGLGCVA